MQLKEIEKVIEVPNNVTEKPLLSICMITYNHEKHIRKALDGVLMQKTNFDFEILLGEDASADKTREICIEYAERFPEKIRLFLHNRSNTIKVNGKPTGRFPFLWNMTLAKGKYIALLDGDDYWTDENKLQKQVDFLEKNKDFVACFHRFRNFDENKNEFSPELFPKFAGSKEDFYENGILITKVNFFETWKTKTLSVVANAAAVKEIIKNPLKYFKDSALFYQLLNHGKMVCLDFDGGVYRIHDGGIYSKASLNKQRFANYRTVEELNRNSNDVILRNRKNKILNKMIEKNTLSENLSLFTKIHSSEIKSFLRFFLKKHL